MAKAMSVKVGSPLRKLVLIKLADNANDKGECWPSYGHVAEQCECSKSSVKEHIAALIKMGFISKENRLGVNNGKGNTSNVYYLTLENPVPRESIAPVPSKSTGGVSADSPVPSESTPPVPPAGTRISHSFEPVNEPIDTPSADADEQEAPKVNAIDFTNVLSAYHEIVPEMPAVKLLTDSRKKTFRNFWKKFNFNQARWEAYLTYIAGNCRWMLEDRPNGNGGFWKCKNFDYLMTERCYVAVKEERANDR